MFTNKMTGILVVAALSSQACMPIAALANPVRIAGQQAFNITTGGAQRAATVQKNVDNALVASTNHTPSAVGVVYVKGQPVLTLGGFYVTTVDAAVAKASHTSPSILAQSWSQGMKNIMKNKSAVDDYVTQLTGSTTANAGTTTTRAGSYPYYKQGRIVYVPAGMTIPVALKSSISSENARIGDAVQAEIAQTVDLGDASIPAGSVISGKITEATAGQKMGRSGMLGMKFDTLRTPDGQCVPITAHIVGGIGTYGEIGTQSNVVQGEATKDKVKQALIRGGIGAGSGAILGTALGAIADGGHGAGRGAIAGTALGGALGVAESLIMRKGGDVNVSSGQTLNLQLDAPASLAASM